MIFLSSRKQLVKNSLANSLLSDQKWKNCFHFYLKNSKLKWCNLVVTHISQINLSLKISTIIVVFNNINFFHEYSWQVDFLTGFLYHPLHPFLCEWSVCVWGCISEDPISIHKWFSTMCSKLNGLQHIKRSSKSH